MPWLSLVPFQPFNCCQFSFSCDRHKNLRMTTSHDDQYHNKTIYGIKNDASRYAWAGYFLFVIISSFVGDTTILIASFKYKAFNLHKIIVVIIQHIAFCDLLVTVTDVLPRFVSLISNEWVFGSSVCYLVIYIGYYFNGVGQLLICNMTTSKLLLLKYPLQCRTTSQKKAHMFCVACWLIAGVIPFTGLLVTVVDGDYAYFSFRIYHCDSGFTSDIWRWLKPLGAGLLFLISNGVVVGTTIYLLIIAKRVARRGPESLKWQGIMTTILTATVYCISVVPSAVYQVGESVVTVDDKSRSFFYTSFRRLSCSFIYLNTISNFYIYSLSVHSFRDFIRSKIQRTQSRMFTSVGTSANHGIIELYYEIQFKIKIISEKISEDFHTFLG